MTNRTVFVLFCFSGWGVRVQRSGAWGCVAEPTPGVSHFSLLRCTGGAEAGGTRAAPSQPPHPLPPLSPGAPVSG